MASPFGVQVLVALGEGQVEYLEIAEASLRQARDTAGPDPGPAHVPCKAAVDAYSAHSAHTVLSSIITPFSSLCSHPCCQRLYDSRQAALLGPLMQQPQACCILATGHQGPHHESLPDAGGQCKAQHVQRACRQGA